MTRAWLMWPKGSESRKLGVGDRYGRRGQQRHTQSLWKWNRVKGEGKSQAATVVLTQKNCAHLQHGKKAPRPFGKCSGMSHKALGVNPGCSLPPTWPWAVDFPPVGFLLCQEQWTQGAPKFLPSPGWGWHKAKLNSSGLTNSKKCLEGRLSWPILVLTLSPMRYLFYCVPIHPSRVTHRVTWLESEKHDFEEAQRETRWGAWTRPPSLGPMTSLIFPWSVGNRVPYSLYLNRERHSGRLHTGSLGMEPSALSTLDGEWRAGRWGWGGNGRGETVDFTPLTLWVSQPALHVGEWESWTPGYRRRQSCYTRLGNSKIEAENGRLFGQDFQRVWCPHWWFLLAQTVSVQLKLNFSINSVSSYPLSLSLFSPFIEPD